MRTGCSFVVMAILKELWSEEINDYQALSIYQYLIDLRERLEQTSKRMTI